MRRLGLDIGTNSIGWALINCDAAHDEYKLIDMGARLWSAEASKADRRAYRLSRKQRRYKKARLRELSEIFNGVLPEQCVNERGKMNPFVLRKKALDNVLTSGELRAVLFHMAKNRGFRSGTEGKKGEEKDIKAFMQRLSETEKKIREGKARTYSELVLQNAPAKLRLREGKEPIGHYPTRKLIKEEFDLIRLMQESHFQALDWDHLAKVLFFEREQIAPRVGKCSIYPAELRLPKNHPLAREFVILEKLSHLTLQSHDNGTTRTLTREEIRTARDLCQKQKKSVKIKQLCKKLKIVGYKPKWEDVEIPLFNDSTAGHFRLSCKAIEDILQQFWSSEDAIGTISQRLSQHRGPAEHGSAQFLEYYGKVMGSVPNFDLVPSCRCENVTSCQHQIAPEERQFGRHPNGTLHVAFNQLRAVVNAIIRKYGSIDEIVVELIRSDWDEGALKKQLENRKCNEEIDSRLEACGLQCSYYHMQKGKLFLEMEKEGRCCVQCPFCGKPFGWESIFSPDVQIEHLVPYSRVKSNALKYLVLSCTECNGRLKAANTPYEAFGSDPTYSQMIQRVPLAKRKYFHQDVELEMEGFLPRALVDTSLIAKAARSYLKSLTPHVWATRGGITSDLRRHLELGIKNRNESHIHHAVDACVIALVSPKILNKMRRYLWDVKRFDCQLFVNEKAFVAQIQNRIDTLLVSHRVNRSLQGAILKATAYGVYDGDSQRRYRAWSPKAKGAKHREEVSEDRQNMEEVGDSNGVGSSGALLGIRAFESAGYAYVDVWQDLEKSSKGCFVFMTKRQALTARSEGKSACQPQEKGRWGKVCRLYKGDYVQDLHGKIWRVKKFNPASGRIFLENPNRADPERKPDLQSCAAKFFVTSQIRRIHVDVLGCVKNRR